VRLFLFRGIACIVLIGAGKRTRTHVVRFFAWHRLVGRTLAVAGWRIRICMKAETLLAELNRLRQDVPKDQADLEWLTLHHVFCFVSYKIGEFQKYVSEQDAKGAFKELEGD
jgi:hypothetical protein